jgi:PAS domain S-box-containing protein
MSSPEKLEKTQVEIDALREELEEARETIRALRNGEIDALVVQSARGAEILTLQGAEKLAASVFEQATEAIIVCDASGKIIRASKAAHDLCSHNPLLQQFDSVFPLFNAEAERIHPTDFARLRDKVKDVPLRGMEVLFECKRGIKRNLLLSASPWIGTYDEFLGCIIILTDITELKSAQRSLSKAANDAQEQNRARGDFIAVLAHELRNPLAPIRNSVAFMRMKQMQDPILRRSLDIVDRQVTNMVRMIDDLLDISRLERGKLNLKKQPADLGAIIRHATESCPYLLNHERRHVTISLPQEALILDADVVRLEQVISNLVGNAAKFTPPDGHIWISAERTSNEVIVRVKDDGAGISEEMLPKIFSMFSQVDHSKSKGGLGIGLALVWQILKLHGGSVQAISAGLGKGSEFIVSLPLSPAGRKPKDEPPVAITKHRPQHVLVVEDNADSRESLALLLSLWGHTVDSAENGRRGVELALSRKPSIAFVDVNLPDIDGYQVARSIRAELQDNITLIALTGYGQPEDVTRALAAGFNRHLVKPADVLELNKIFQPVSAQH